MTNKLIVAISSRALFDFEEENKVFEELNSQAYMELQLERFEQPAHPGVAFPLVKKLLALNTEERQWVDIVILSRNDPVSGMRVFRSAEAAGLNLGRGVFTRGREPYRFLNPLGAHLFLSANSGDVRAAIEAGFPAAKVFSSSLLDAERHPEEIRIAFDGDAVLFSDEAEKIYRANGIHAFEAHERGKADRPLPPGPFKPFLAALHQIQQDGGSLIPIKIRTALVTARSAPAHERAIRTLMDWEISIDEAMFLGGLEKGPFLREFEPDFFFDDQTRHCNSAVQAGPAGHIISGVANE